MQSGINKTAQYLGPGTGIQIVIVIKVYPRKANGIAMVALRYQRGEEGPSYAVSFGTQALEHESSTHINEYRGAQLVGVGTDGGGPCNAAGIADYQFRLPVKLMTTGVDPAGLPLYYSFDLFEFQTRIVTE